MDEPGQGRGGPSKVGVYDRGRGKSRRLLWLVLVVAAVLIELFWLREANAASAVEPVAVQDAPAVVAPAPAVWPTAA